MTFPSCLKNLIANGISFEHQTGDAKLIQRCNRLHWGNFAPVCAIKQDAVTLLFILHLTGFHWIGCQWHGCREIITRGSSLLSSHFTTLHKIKNDPARSVTSSLFISGPYASPKVNTHLAGQVTFH